MRLEGDAVVVDMGEPVLAMRDDIVGPHRLRIHRENLLEPDPERQHLEAAAVGNRRTVPAHERRHPARLIDDVGAGLQVEVVRVREDHLRAELAHRLRQHRLHGRLGADRREGWRADLAVRGRDDTGPAQ